MYAFTYHKPTSARQAATLDAALGGRLLLNVVPGGDAAELAAEGVYLSHDQRYEAAEEFLTVWKRLLSGETVDFDGAHFKIKGAHNQHPAAQQPHPVDPRHAQGLAHQPRSADPRPGHGLPAGRCA